MKNFTRILGLPLALALLLNHFRFFLAVLEYSYKPCSRLKARALCYHGWWVRRQTQQKENDPPRRGEIYRTPYPLANSILAKTIARCESLGEQVRGRAKSRPYKGLQRASLLLITIQPVLLPR